MLLVGGDTYDYRNYLGYGGLSFIPSLYAPSGDIVSYAPADGLFADTDGDRIPDVAIGRFPVRTSADVDALVEKTLQYETLINRKSLLLAADGYDAPTHFSFSQSSEELAAWVPPAWQIDRVYLDAMTVADARIELLVAVERRRRGDQLHGSLRPDRLDVRWAVQQRGCRRTRQRGPADGRDAVGLLDLLLRRAGQQHAGAQAAVERHQRRRGSPRRDDAHRGALRAGALAGDLQPVFEPGATLGQAVLEAKRSLAAGGDPAVLDVLLGWNLLGDPTLGLGGEGSGAASEMPFLNGFEAADRPWSAIQQ